MKLFKLFFILLVAFVLFDGLAFQSFAGQTGKIAGKVIDRLTGDLLPAVNIVLEGTNTGAAADLEGDFIILNVQPGTYVLVASMIGYKTTRVADVKVSVDRTTRVDIRLEPTVLDIGESIVVVAEQPVIQKDLTATSYSVSSDEILTMPVENVQEILQLQAGIVQDTQGDLHIRGGRSSEISYMIDGISISDPYSGKIGINVDQSTIQELKVISGTFNAEYGKVMSGIVEIVTKDPENSYHSGASFYLGDYVSAHKKLFYHIDDVKPTSIYNAQLYLSGPMPYSNNLSFYLSLRRYYDEGWLFGQRRFNTTDSSNFQNPDAIYFQQTGDGKSVPMNDLSQYFANAKLVLKITPSIKLSYNFLGDRYDRNYYNHLYKYNPDGEITSHQYGYTHIINFNHTLSSKTFYTIKLSRNYTNFKSYLYENPADQRYVNPIILQNREDDFSFLTGGTNMNHFRRSTTINTVKIDLTSQITKLHQVKSGIEFKDHDIFARSQSAYFRGLENGGIFNSEAFFNKGDVTQRPLELAAYLQDKIELKNMTLNIGLRYDYFYSNGKMPDDMDDPGGTNPESTGGFHDPQIKHQLSPRLGIAFPITDKGVFHTSYGHFFQLPMFEYLYTNPRFVVAPGGVRTLMGNADLNPQSTVIYEVGFQQELMAQVGVDLTGFYKDTRDLLGTRIYDTYRSGYQYARYENRDYGNIRGITLAFNKKPTATDHITVGLDYTFQVAEGNASDPKHEYYNNIDYPPKKSNIQVVPLDWDQRHTINFSISYNNPRLFGIGLISQFQSGLPYTPEVQTKETTFENSGRKPFNYNIDLRLSRQFTIGIINLNLFLKVYNLFDRKNEINVFNDTGRAGYSLQSHYLAERRAYINTLDEWLTRPDYYSEPRKIIIGFDLDM